MRDAKKEIENAIETATMRLRDRTGIIAEVSVCAIDISTHERWDYQHVVTLHFKYGRM